MDEEILQSAMTILYLAKLLDGSGRLPKFLDLVGNDLEICWDNQYIAERCACECVFQNTKVYYHEGKPVSRDEWTENREVYVFRDPILNRFDTLCREYEAQRSISKVENPYARRLEDTIHHAMQFRDYSYDYLWKDGTEDRKGPKIVLFLFEEFCSYCKIPEGLCEVIDFCVSGIKQLERELEKQAVKIISPPTAVTPEYKEAA